MRAVPSSRATSMTPRKITASTRARARARSRASGNVGSPNHPTGRSRRLHRRLRRFRRRRRDGNAERDVIAGSATVRRAKIALTATVRAHLRARDDRWRARIKNNERGSPDHCIRKKTPSGHERESSRVESSRRRRRRRRRPSQRVDARTNRGHAKIVSRRLASSRVSLSLSLSRDSSARDGDARDIGGGAAEDAVSGRRAGRIRHASVGEDGMGRGTRVREASRRDLEAHSREEARGRGRGGRGR